MIWSLALCPDDAKQDPVVYGAEFGVVFLAKGRLCSITIIITIQVRRIVTIGTSYSSTNTTI